MTANDWFLSVSIGTLSLVLGVAAYFIQKWIQTVDESIKDNSQEIRAISKEVGNLKDAKKADTKEIAKTISEVLGSFKPPGHAKIDKIEEDVTLIKSVTQDKVLPQLNSLKEHFGKVIMLENRLGEQETKLVKVFRAVEILVEKKKSDPK